MPLKAASPYPVFCSGVFFPAFPGPPRHAADAADAAACGEVRFVRTDSRTDPASESAPGGAPAASPLKITRLRSPEVMKYSGGLFVRWDFFLNFAV